MAAIDEIYRYLNEIAPFSTAMDFDNAGFLVGDGKTEVTKALVTLDTVSYTHLDVYKRQRLISI